MDISVGGIISRGPGLAFTEGHAVSPEGRTTPEDAGIWSDAHAAAWKPIVEFSHSQNQKIGIQIVHSGRKASTVPPWANAPPLAGPEIGGWPDNAWGPSTVPFSPDLPTPHELSVEGIKRIVRDFANAAKRSIEVGFDVIEIHAAHGFLLSSFLSPLSNHRQDNYGGSFENRIRLTLEVVDAIRAVIPAETPLFLRQVLCRLAIQAQILTPLQHLWNRMAGDGRAWRAFLEGRRYRQDCTHPR